MKRNGSKHPPRKLSIATATLRRLDAISLGDVRGGTGQTDVMGCYGDTSPIPDTWWNCGQ